MSTTQTVEKKVIAFTTKGSHYKSTDNAGRPCFAIDGEYTLGDGSTHKKRITSKTKRDLPDRIKSAETSARGGSIVIEFTEHGVFEVQRFTTRPTP